MTVRLFGEIVPLLKTWQIRENMTVRLFGDTNNLANSRWYCLVTDIRYCRVPNQGPGFRSWAANWSNSCHRGSRTSPSPGKLAATKLFHALQPLGRPGGVPARDPAPDIPRKVPANQFSVTLDPTRGKGKTTKSGAWGVFSSSRETRPRFSIWHPTVPPPRVTRVGLPRNC